MVEDDTTSESRSKNSVTPSKEQPKKGKECKEYYDSLAMIGGYTCNETTNVSASDSPTKKRREPSSCAGTPARIVKKTRDGLVETSYQSPVVSTSKSTPASVLENLPSPGGSIYRGSPRMKRPRMVVESPAVAKQRMANATRVADEIAAMFLP